ncbi:hypothetical protein A0H81_04355 [Grifola frondosa]|uniref:Late embryogenesis abundant protein LEA-2 subgroup domain-containing protein n=1 Tax=Grifola frondosa TaxID=5627 RepID=A0A1C7MF59_GRIFR|nr:hypothetical protein A0H81_04355 [Grifola frondosa]
MAYRPNQYSEPQYPQQYQDAPFNPYETQQPHPTYDQGGYGYGDTNDAGRYGGFTDDPSGRAKERDRSVFENDDTVPSRPVGPRTSSNMRRWRYDHQGNLWTKGGRGRCFGRFFCCTIMIFVFIVLSILLSLALWLRPPNVVIAKPSLDATSANAFQFSSTGLNISIPINISVNNPDYFSVVLKKVDAQLFYPLNNTDIGGGSLSDVNFASHTETNFTLPLVVEYKLSDDPNGDILLDLAKRCGVIPGTSASSVTIDYKITLGIKVLVIPVNPVINDSISFSCDLSSSLSAIEGLLKAAGINIGSLLLDLRDSSAS